MQQVCSPESRWRSPDRWEAGRGLLHHPRKKRVEESENISSDQKMRQSPPWWCSRSPPCTGGRLAPSSLRPGTEEWNDEQTYQSPMYPADGRNPRTHIFLLCRWHFADSGKRGWWVIACVEKPTEISFMLLLSSTLITGTPRTWTGFFCHKCGFLSRIIEFQRSLISCEHTRKKILGLQHVMVEFSKMVPKHEKSCYDQKTDHWKNYRRTVL